MLSLRTLRTLTFALGGMGALVLCLALSGAATAGAPPPSVTSFTSSVTTLPPEGAPFSLAATVLDGGTCTISVAPALDGFPVSMPCAPDPGAQAKGIVTKKPGSGNPSGRALKYVFTLTVTNSAGSVTVSSLHPSFVQASYRWNVSSRPLGLPAPPRAVSCGSPTFCMVVGEQGEVTTFTDAAISQRINANDRRVAMADASCSGTRCMLLNDRGNYFLYSGGKLSGENPLFENGSQLRLTSVSCASATFCMAVGDGGAAASFDGPTPTDRTASGHAWNNSPRYVSCSSAHLCVVVTDTGDGFGWDGSTWTSLGLVDPGGHATGVSCASGGTCSIADGSGPAVTGKVSGGSWLPTVTVQPPPSLRAISCSTPSYCLALDDAGGVEQRVSLVWSPRSNIRSSPPVISSCSRGFATPVGALCAAIAGDGQTMYTGRIAQATTPTCETAPHVGQVQMSVTPAAGAGGFVYAPGQFFEGDTVGFSATASPSCVTAKPGMHYSWSLASRPAGSSAALSSSSAPSPSFVPDKVGTYEVRVVATDSLGNPSAPQSLTISTGSCGANRPTVSITVGKGLPMDTRSVQGNVSVEDNDASACPVRFNQTLSYAWSVVSGPSGGSFSDAKAPSPTFTPGGSGTYVVQLVATGQKSGQSGFAQTTLDATCSPPSSSPSISEVNGASYAGEPVLNGDDVTLAANPSSTCFSRPAFTYSWSLSSPPGSSASLSSSTSSTPTFTPDVSGDYVLQLVVTDSTGRSSAPQTITINTSTCGASPVVAPVDMTVTPADSTDGFAYAPGQFFTGDTVGLHTSASATCRAARIGVMTYAWTISGRPAGSTATLSNPSSSTPSFVPDKVGTYEVRVVATDSLGNSSPPESLTITSDTCGANPPVVVISVGTGMPMDTRTVFADVEDRDNSASCPARFAQTYSYVWSVVSGPGGGSFSDAIAPSPSFTPDLPGTYVVRVLVTGGTSGVSGSAQTTIDSTCAAPTASPSITELNGQPFGGGVLLTGDNLKLDADATSACSSLSQTFTYQWHMSQIPAGSSAALSSVTAASPSFTPDVDGTYVVDLVVTDPWGRSSNVQSLTFDAATCSATAQVGTVTPAPGAGAFVYAAKQFFRDDTVSLDASPSSSCRSAPGQALTYHWRITAQPAASSATLNNPSSQNPSFVPDVVGTYQLSVRARDSFGNVSQPADLTISTGSCGANTPSVSVDAVPGGKPMDTVQLTANVSDDDNDTGKCPARFHQTYSYAWSVVSGPGGGGGGGSGGSVGFSDATAASPTFTPDVPGTYVLKVVATGDTSGLSGSGQTTVDATCAAPTIDQVSIAELNGAPYGGEQVVSGDTVKLGATATSSCLSTPAFTYAWSLSSRPAGSSASLSSSTDPTPSFTPDVSGTYQFSVTVTDETGLKSEPRTLDLSVAPPPS